MQIRILIVDDNEVARGILREVISAGPGWTVCGEAVNGADAVVKAAELKPDLIVMDMAMPEMDGLHASQEILKVLPGVPIILHTMHTGEQVSLVASQMGVRKVVSKTASDGALERAIEECLRNRTETTAATVRTSDSPATMESDENLAVIKAVAASAAESAAPSKESIDPPPIPKQN